MKKKVALTITSIALVAALAIGGTLAWLTNQTGPVINTFIAGTGITLDLFEHKYDPETQKVDPTQKVTDGQDNYAIVPGATNEKDPTLEFTGNASWLYAEVVNGVNTAVADAVTINFDERWTKLDVTGPNGGDIYYLEAAKADTAQDYVIFNSITYNKDLKTETIKNIADANAAITIYGYAVQKGEDAAVNSAQNAWTTADFQKAV